MFYIGFTRNLKQRINQHHRGHNKSTSTRRPLMLIYCEAHLAKKDAQRREQYFKTFKGKRTLRQMLSESLSMLKQ